MIKETYLSKVRRDVRYKELKAMGENPTRRVATNQQLHPEYIKDAALEGITYQTGLGNVDYQRMWGKLYIVEA